jgi:CDP-paratose 2-epimerase
MAPKSVLVTGSSGLMGSECVAYFDRLGWRVHGVDNNMRMVFFGADGDTRTIAQRLVQSCRNLEHYDLDIRFRQGVLRLIKEVRPALVIHCAAQPSHELAKACIFHRFDINTCVTAPVWSGEFSPATQLPGRASSGTSPLYVVGARGPQDKRLPLCADDCTPLLASTKSTPWHIP